MIIQHREELYMACSLINATSCSFIADLNKLLKLSWRGTFQPFIIGMELLSSEF